MVDLKSDDGIHVEVPRQLNGYHHITATPPQHSESDHGTSFRRSAVPFSTVLMDLACIGAMAIGVGYGCWLLANAILPYPEERVVEFPSTFAQVKEQASIFREMIEQEWYSVTLVYSCIYIWKQTFSLPGSSLMNVLGGVLFGFNGFPLACVLTGIGASCCFLVSRLFGSRLVQYLRSPSTTADSKPSSFVQRFQSLQTAIEKEDREGNLYIYLIGIRIFPFTPNWFLNMVCPHVGVGIKEFFVTILLGLIPYNFVTTQAGTVISSVNSLSDVLTIQTLGLLMLIAGVIIGIAYVKHRLGIKDENSVSSTGHEAASKGAHVD